MELYAKGSGSGGKSDVAAETRVRLPTSRTASTAPFEQVVMECVSIEFYLTMSILSGTMCGAYPKFPNPLLVFTPSDDYY